MNHLIDKGLDKVETLVSIYALIFFPLFLFQPAEDLRTLELLLAGIYPVLNFKPSRQPGDYRGQPWLFPFDVYCVLMPIVLLVVYKLHWGLFAVLSMLISYWIEPETVEKYYKAFAFFMMLIPFLGGL